MYCLWAAVFLAVFFEHSINEQIIENSYRCTSDTLYSTYQWKTNNFNNLISTVLSLHSAHFIFDSLNGRCKWKFLFWPKKFQFTCTIRLAKGICPHTCYKSIQQRATCALVTCLRAMHTYDYCCSWLNATESNEPRMLARSFNQRDAGTADFFCATRPNTSRHTSRFQDQLQNLFWIFSFLLFRLHRNAMPICEIKTHCEACRALTHQHFGLLGVMHFTLLFAAAVPATLNWTLC